MNDDLPELVYANLAPTRDYLQDVAKVLGKMQQAFLPESSRGWQYGLEVTMRGIVTQSFDFNGQPLSALLDLVRHKVRFGEKNWRLSEIVPADLFDEIQAIAGKPLNRPDFTSNNSSYDAAQTDKYAAALWWLERQFSQLRSNLTEDLVGPILLYPHHFDLSLAWFPKDDEQLTIGWSAGDEAINEPYIYLTSYPDAKKINAVPLLPETTWQTDGFEGVIMPYENLRRASEPAVLFKKFTDLYL